MYSNLIWSQLQNRFCGTILRLNWLVALVSLVPLLFALLAVVAVSMVVIYLFIMIILVIISFGLLLLNDNFRNMFSAEGIEQIQPMVDSVIEAYSSVMPLLIVMSIIFSLVSVVLILIRKQAKGRVSGIVSALFCALIVIVSACIYYGFILQV